VDGAYHHLGFAAANNPRSVRLCLTAESGNQLISKVLLGRGMGSRKTHNSAAQCSHLATECQDLYDPAQPSSRKHGLADLLNALNLLTVHVRGLLGYGAGFHGIRNLTLLLVLFRHHPWESYEL
jgi:hypothetical protein